MKEKELIEFMHSLWNRGLISVSPDEFDYEWVVWDYLKLRQPLVISSVCDGCGSKFDAMDISVGVCYCCQKEIKQTDL